MERSQERIAQRIHFDLDALIQGQHQHQRNKGKDGAIILINQCIEQGHT